MTTKQIARPYTKIEPSTEQYCVELWLGDTKLMTTYYDSQHSAQMAQAQLDLAVSLAVNHGVEQVTVLV